jgi:uncharacterized protein YecE (DUF72 family)
MARFSLGCAIWSFPGWVGALFPLQSKPADFLRLYGQRFTAVEGNTTFYATPEEATVIKWRSETPAGFRFSPKIPKALTHTGLLRPVLPAALQFLQRMQGLQDRLGTMMLQLPPSYGPECLGDLRAFLQGWPCDEAPIAVEVRHLAWFKEPHAKRLTDLLQLLHVGRVIMDSRPIYQEPQDLDVVALCKKPRVPALKELTAPFTLIRYVSHPEAARNEDFLQEWALQVSTWLTQGTDVDFFVHCPREEKTPQNAKRFQNLLEEKKAPVPSLPWLQLPERKQLKLF